jgi:hypothetical protein
MGLTMREKQAVTREMVTEYTKATKKEKGRILDSFTELTGYNRSYAARVLRQRADPVVLTRLTVGQRRRRRNADAARPTARLSRSLYRRCG